MLQIETSSFPTRETFRYAHRAAGSIDATFFLRWLEREVLHGEAVDRQTHTRRSLSASAGIYRRSAPASARERGGRLAELAVRRLQYWAHSENPLEVNPRRFEIVIIGVASKRGDEKNFTRRSPKY